MGLKRKNNLNKKDICFIIIKYCKFLDFDYKSSEFLTNKNEIDNYLQTSEKDSLFFIYKYKNNIEEILYNSEEYIEIKKEMLSEIKEDELNGIKDYFYLDKLITENKEIINYTYEISLIREVNEKNKKVNNFIYLKIIISKIILELINNYEQTPFYEVNEENELDELKEIKQSNIEIIEKNIEVFKELNSNFNVDYIIKTSIDEIYIEIIINLIENNKFCDEKYIQGIIKQLDFENIILTKIMLERISNTLNSSKQIKDNYEIKKFDDLFNDSKINFYYVLFKYIIKNTFYKYQIKFLNDMTKITRDLIKNNFQPFDEKKIEEEEIKGKFEEFIRSITDSQYYLKLLYNKNKDNNNINNNHNNSTTSPNSIDLNCKKYKEKIIEFNGELIKFAKKLLNNSTFLIKNNEKCELILSILNDEKKDNMESFDDIDINEENLKYNVYKFIDFLLDIKKRIKESFNNKFNLMIKIKTYNTSYSLNSNGTYNIDCFYIFYSPKDSNKSSFKDDNILVNGINGKCQGFYYFINEINDDCYNETKFDINLDIIDYINKIDKLEEEKQQKDDEKNKKENHLNLIDIGNLSGVSELKVLEMRKKFDNLDAADFLEQFSNGIFVAGGNCKTLCIYNENYKYIKQINLPNYPIGIGEIRDNNEEYLKIVIFYRKKEITLISLNKFDFTHKTEIYETNSYIFLLLSNNNYIYSDERGTFLSANLFDNNSYNAEEKISKYSFKNGIEIDKNLLLLISNNIVPEGKEKLIIYDRYRREIEYELEGYPYNITKNSLFLMKNRDYKIVICACKKNTKYQKNGILLVNSHIEDNQDIFDSFYYTSSFEPYSFCELKYIYKTEKEIKNFETFYFLVGGFDSTKGVGVIKLYKIIYEYKAYNSKIEYIDDIIFENDNFHGFEGPITSLIQSRKTGEILASCSDGTIYLLSPPNLNYFLFYDEQETQDSSYIKKNLFNEPEKKIDNKYNKTDNQKMFNLLLEKIGKKI